ncbi:MAG: NAD-dependent isocitrate dehydrogenase, partial [Deltaproteobacteria bacterium]|nr:NAD-dependent isocitrate dehydrogenase [Deltaproteobacteria bacterium]
NIGDRYAVFEAVHGSAPDIAGKGIANPTALIQSGVLLLRHIGERRAADRLERGLFRVLAEGRIRTGDLGGKANTAEFTDAICAAVQEDA